jgi:hypothetical protein
MHRTAVVEDKADDTKCIIKATLYFIECGVCRTA